MTTLTPEVLQQLAKAHMDTAVHMNERANEMRLQGRHFDAGIAAALSISLTKRARNLEGKARDRKTP